MEKDYKIPTICRDGILCVAKPILFNTDMVQAILDGRKTATRRAIKHNVNAILNSLYHKEHPEVSDKTLIEKLCLPKYKKGYLLYVRETWHTYEKRIGKGKSCRMKLFYGYRASIANSEDASVKWRPSIHMPKEAARIFLRVIDVRVERLRDITDIDLHKEGITKASTLPQQAISEGLDMFEKFAKLWDSTIKKSDLDKYGWDANPWVWVYEFERVEVQE